jgi:hypothetical protein
VRALLLTLVACGGSAPVSNTAKARPDAPQIAWGQERFAWTHLPAIARDRSLAVVPLVDNDGGRGFPNLRVEIRDKFDQTTEGINVLNPNEYERLVVDGKPSKQLDARIATANQQLRGLHDAHDLVEMTVVDPAKTGVKYENHKLTLANGRVVDGTAWKAPAGKRCEQCEPCENPELLKNVYAAPGIDAIVVDIAYQGTDTCWEPADQWHLIVW